MTAGPEGVRFLLVAGRPLKEPVAWHGPIVMNTRDELTRAMRSCATGPSSASRRDRAQAAGAGARREAISSQARLIAAMRALASLTVSAGRPRAIILSG